LRDTLYILIEKKLCLNLLRLNLKRNLSSISLDISVFRNLFRVYWKERSILRRGTPLSDSTNIKWERIVNARTSKINICANNYDSKSCSHKRRADVCNKLPFAIGQINRSNRGASVKWSVSGCTRSYRRVCYRYLVTYIFLRSLASMHPSRWRSLLMGETD